MPNSCVLVLLLLVANSIQAVDRPNVILIVTDDQGYGDMSCHENPWLRTPNLDRLSAESVRLKDYHVEPVCTPTRASLMTGRYASRVGAWTVTQGRQLLQPDEVTMADVFSDSGYRTGMFGKWHLGDTWPYAPRFRGFQDVVRHLAGGIDEIDNGTAVGAGSDGSSVGFNAGMRGKKGSVYAGGHRVACFVRWPGRLKAGHEIKQLTSCRDWLPTLIELGELDAPKSVRFDGQSLVPLMTGDDRKWPDRTLFVERQGDQPTLNKPNGPRARYPHYAVLTERWRLVDGALFDIVDDPGQKRNVTSEHEDVARDLRARYERHFTDVFSDNTAYTRFQLGAREENPTLLTVRDWHPTAGNVIWKQEQLGDDALAINGFWAVNVVRAGHYSIRLSRFPDDAPQAMRVTRAVLRIGEQEREMKLDENKTSVTFELDLPEGHGLLQCWLSGEAGGARGAYFVQVTRLNE